MDKLWKHIILASAIVLAAIVLASAYTQRYRLQTGTITVTGLGETEFTSDIIIVKGEISVENFDSAEGYNSLERDRNKVIAFIEKLGLSKDDISFAML